MVTDRITAEPTIQECRAGLGGQMGDETNSGGVGSLIESFLRSACVTPYSNRADAPGEVDDWPEQRLLGNRIIECRVATGYGAASRLDSQVLKV
jgi:hypothetical protein